MWTTLELPNKQNLKDISCIPTGRYHCTRVENRITHSGVRIPATFLVNDVPNRGGILFHTGNRAEDSKGCILIAQGFSEFKGVPWITNSRVGFDSFMAYMKGADSFELVVENLWG